MKKLLFLITFSILTTSTVNADYGNALLYHAKFYLKDGTIFNGCFETAGDWERAYLDKNGKNRYCNDEGILELFKLMQQDEYNHFDQRLKNEEEENKVTIYKKMNYISPKPMRSEPRRYAPSYGYVNKSDVIYLDSNDISKMIFWSAEISNRDWVTSEIVFGNQFILDKIKEQQYWNSVLVKKGYENDSLKFLNDICMGEPDEGFVLYNYNSTINSAELKRLVKLKFPIDHDRLLKNFMANNNLPSRTGWPPETSRRFQKYILQYTQKIRDWFLDKDVLIVRINGTC